MKAKYEWLKLRNVWTGEPVLDEEGDYMSWATQIPRGWYIAFGEQMIDELNEILVKFGFEKEYRISQIKEKYGTLRWYEYTYISDMQEEYYEWLRKYEDLSAETCIVCGAPGEIRRNLWIEPLCDEHNK